MYLDALDGECLGEPKLNAVVLAGDKKIEDGHGYE